MAQLPSYGLASGSSPARTGPARGSIRSGPKGQPPCSTTPPTRRARLTANSPAPGYPERRLITGA